MIFRAYSAQRGAYPHPKGHENCNWSSLSGPAPCHLVDQGGAEEGLGGR